MSQVGKRPADEKVNGDLSSPSKVAKVEDSPENLSKEKKLARMKDFFSQGGPKPPPPKPKPKKPPITIAESTARNTTSPPMSPDSAGVEDPGPIILNTESLRQLSTIMEIDLDAVVRQQDILENQAQKDRAALSQSKGLQTRRLPKNYASKVPEDYAVRRRAQTYSTSALGKSPSISDEIDSPMRGNTPELSEEERKQRFLSRSGLSQGSNPLAALGNILKRNSLKGSKSPKSPKKSTSDSPRSTPKMKKKETLDAPDSGSFSKGLFGSLRRSGKKKNKSDTSTSATTSANVSTEDLRTDISSIASMPIHPSPRHNSPISTSTPVKQTDVHSSNVSPLPSMDRTKTTSYQSPVHDKPRDSALFREPSVERLFDSDSSNLFGSSELDAFFKKEKEKTPERSIPESKPTPAETKAKEPEPIKSMRQSESKSKLLSRIHAYEKASVSESISESPPLEEECSKEKEVPEEDNKNKEDATETSKPVRASNLFDDVEEDDLFAPPKPQRSSARTSNQSDLSKKKASLFEDELFQDNTLKSKPATKEPPKIMKKPKKSIEEKEPKKEIEDSSVKASVPKETVATIVKPETKVEEKPKVEEAPTKSKSPPPEEKSKTEEKPQKDDEPSEKKPETSSFLDYESDLPVYGLRRKPRASQVESVTKETTKTEHKSVEKKTSGGLFDDDESELPPFGLRRSRQRVDVDKKETEEAPGSAKEKGLFDDHDEDLPPYYGHRMQSRRLTEEIDEGTDLLFDEADKGLTEQTTLKDEPEDIKTPDSVLDEKTKIEIESEECEKEKKDKPAELDDLFGDDKVEDKVVDTKEEAPSQSPEVQVRSPTPEETADKQPDAPTETKEIEEKKTEIKRPSTTRDRSATELGTAATGKDVRKSTSDRREGKKEPSWMANLKKREGSDKIAASSTAKKSIKTSGVSKDEDIPDWQKRVLERRKKKAAAAEANKTSTTRTATGSASPRAGRLSAKTETTTSKSATKSSSIDRVSGRRSPVTGRKSPLSGRKSPIVERKLTDKITTERKSRFSRDKDEHGLSKVTSTRRIGSKDSSKAPSSKDEKSKEQTIPAAAKSSKEEEVPKLEEQTDSGTTKPKPKLSKKPSIEIVSKKIRISSSKSSHSSTTSPEPTDKPSKPEETEDEVFEEGKKPAPSKEGTPSPILSIEILSSVLGKEASITTPPEPTKESEEPVKEFKEPAKESEEPAKESDEPAKESDEPAKESDEPAKENGEPATSSCSDSVSSDRGQSGTPPYRSHSISRSPTPTSPTGPLKLSTEPDLPEWKRKLLEKKKNSGSTASHVTKRATGTSSTKKEEPELPAWKKELLARKQGRTSPERKARSATVSVTSRGSASSTRTGRRGKVEETPDFMKEFKRKQKAKD